jgi:hypothetical protein
MKKRGVSAKIIKILIVTVLSAAVWIISILYGGIHYETNDDTVINLIAAGAFGKPSQYLIYTSALMGYGIKVLYWIFGSINCYLWCYLVLNLLAVIAIVYILTEDIGYVGTALCALLVNVILAKDLYISLQYTKNASLYGAVGFLLLVSFLDRGGKKWLRLLAGTMFIALSFSSRKESFFFLVPFGLAALFFAALPYFEKGLSESASPKMPSAESTEIRSGRHFVPQILHGKLFDPNSSKSGGNRKLLLSLTLPLAVIILSVIVDRHMYYGSPEWADYTKINIIMTDKLDYGNYNFEWHRDKYEAAGFTEWDFRFLDECTYNDIENFSRERLEKIEEIGGDIKMNRLRFDREILEITVADMGGSFWQSLIPFATVVVSAIALILAFLCQDTFALAAIAVQLMGLVAGSYYLSCLRRAIWRVKFGLWFAALLMIMGCVIIPLIRRLLERSSGAGAQTDNVMPENGSGSGLQTDQLMVEMDAGFVSQTDQVMPENGSGSGLQTDQVMAEMDAGSGSQVNQGMVENEACSETQKITEDMLWKPNKKASGICLAVLALFCVVVTGAWFRGIDFDSDAFAKTDNERYEMIHRMNDSDSLFVMSLDNMFGGLCGAINIFEINSDYAGFYSHVIPAGGWIVPAPIAELYANENGIANVYRSLPERDDLYYYGGGEHMGYMLMYLNEKYGPGIQVREERFDGFTAWKFYR